MRHKKISLLMMGVVLLIGGCSCSKVNENTYNNAVNVYKNTDAISFTRIEEIMEDGSNIYTRKRVDATISFDSDKSVNEMQYELTYYDMSMAGGSDISQASKYYYIKDDAMLYTYSHVVGNQLQRYKEHADTYEQKVNVNSCENLDCIRMISTNFAPIHGINEITNFIIEDDDGKGIVTYSAVCPNFENCENNSQIIDFTMVINKDGNFETLSYEIRKGNTTSIVKYTFQGFGSNNVSVTFPSDLATYDMKN